MSDDDPAVRVTGEVGPASLTVKVEGSADGGRTWQPITVAKRCTVCGFVWEGLGFPNAQDPTQPRPSLCEVHFADDQRRLQTLVAASRRPDLLPTDLEPPRRTADLEQLDFPPAAGD